MLSEIELTEINDLTQSKYKISRKRIFMLANISNSFRLYTKWSEAKTHLLTNTIALARATNLTLMTSIFGEMERTHLLGKKLLQFSYVC